MNWNSLKDNGAKLMKRTASAAEKADLWPKIVAAYKVYADYQQRTGRRGVLAARRNTLPTCAHRGG